MDEQEKELKEQTPATEEQPQADQVEKMKEATEKIWGSTKHAWNTATFKANQYKKLVQKKIDQSALHKKIHVAHGDLGKLIDDLRESGKKNILNLVEVKEILTRIDELKAEAVALEQEVEEIRNEDLPEDLPQEQPQEQPQEEEQEKEKTE